MEIVQLDHNAFCVTRISLDSVPQLELLTTTKPPHVQVGQVTYTVLFCDIIGIVNWAGFMNYLM